MARRLDLTQVELVKRRLLSGVSLSQTDFLQESGGRSGWRLAAHIHTLRKKHRWPIISHKLPTENEHSFGAPVRYVLKPSWRPGGGGPDKQFSLSL